MATESVLHNFFVGTFLHAIWRTKLFARSIAWGPVGLLVKFGSPGKHEQLEMHTSWSLENCNAFVLVLVSRFLADDGAQGQGARGVPGRSQGLEGEGKPEACRICHCQCQSNMRLAVTALAADRFLL